MKERVTTLLGTSNIILVAPHNHDMDDSNTGEIAIAAAKSLNAHAIINNGWKRSKTVDELKSEANCNNIDHCNNPVVKAEFLDPINYAINSVQNNYKSPPLILTIHGVGNSIRTKARDSNLDIIVGFGAGDKPRLTCTQWLTDSFMDTLTMFWRAYEGAPGGDYSARSSKNLTQALHRTYLNQINILQLEFVYAIRKDNLTAEDVGMKLAIVTTYVNSLTSYKRPDNVACPPKI